MTLSSAPCLFVLYVEDLEASRRFFSACGLDFASERHGAGPLHYSSTSRSGLVVELYPRGGKPATRTRFGLAVDDMTSTLRNLEKLGPLEAKGPMAMDYGQVFMVRDPDGNVVELVAGNGA